MLKNDSLKYKIKFVLTEQHPSITRQFHETKCGDSSHLWLVDTSGVIEKSIRTIDTGISSTGINVCDTRRDALHPNMSLDTLLKTS